MQERRAFWINSTRFPPAFKPPSWYVQPEQQIKRVAEFLEVHGGGSGFTLADIPPAPTNFVSVTPTEVLLLTVFLPDKARSAQRTLDAWWDFVVSPIGYTKVRWDQLKSDSKHLRLVPIIEYPGIRWVAFDPNANQGKSPQSCWEDANMASTLAGPEVLMAAALFPDWPTSWNGGNSPYPNMAGYQFKWETAWQDCPSINRWDDPRQLKLDAYWADNAYDYWACPSVREF